MDRYQRHRSGVALCSDIKFDADVLARPKAAVLIREESLDRDRAGSRVDARIDKGQLARGEHLVTSVGEHANGRRVLAAESLADEIEIPLRQGERHAKGLHLRDRDKAVPDVIAAAHKIAFGDSDDPEPPADRSLDRSVAELDLVRFESRLVGSH